MDAALERGLWRQYELVLLALTIWREARGESRDARIAVGGSIKNRVDRPSWWGTDWISVMRKKWQYSSLTDPHDPQLTNWPAADDAAFAECLELADGIMAGRYRSTMLGADSYFDSSIAPPKWAAEHPDRKIGTIGRLTFYNLDQDVEPVRMG